MASGGAQTFLFLCVLVSTSSTALPPSALQSNNAASDLGTIPSFPATPQSTRINPASGSSSGRLPPAVPLPSTHSHLNTHLKRSMDDVAATIRKNGITTVSPNEELLLSVVRLVPADKDKRIKELCSMADYEFTRANNIASHNSSLAKLGFKPTTTIPPSEDEDEPEGDRAYVPDDASSPTSTPTRRLTRRTTGHASPLNKDPVLPGTEETTEPSNATPPPLPPNNQAPATEASDDDSSSANDNMDVDPAPSTSTSSAQHAHIPDPVNDAGDANAPLWFANAIATFDSVDESVYGGEWFIMVRAWRDIERHFGYEADVCLLRLPIIATHVPSYLGISSSTVIGIPPLSSPLMDQICAIQERLHEDPRSRGQLLRKAVVEVVVGC